MFQRCISVASIPMELAASFDYSKHSHFCQETCHMQIFSNGQLKCFEIAMLKIRSKERRNASLSGSFFPLKSNPFHLIQIIIIGIRSRLISVATKLLRMWVIKVYIAVRRCSMQIRSLSLNEYIGNEDRVNSTPFKFIQIHTVCLNSFQSLKTNKIDSISRHVNWSVSWKSLFKKKTFEAMPMTTKTSNCSINSTWNHK